MYPSCLCKLNDPSLSLSCKCASTDFSCALYASCVTNYCITRGSTSTLCIFFSLSTFSLQHLSLYIYVYFNSEIFNKRWNWNRYVYYSFLILTLRKLEPVFIYLNPRKSHLSQCKILGMLRSLLSNIFSVLCQLSLQHINCRFNYICTTAWSSSRKLE